jgi:hypothetical protein
MRTATSALYWLTLISTALLASGLEAQAANPV